jgi:hypothetical protein
MLQKFTRLRTACCDTVLLLPSDAHDGGESFSEDEGPSWLIDRESADVVFAEVGGDG